ncbi:Ig-like domain-containing protein [Paucibacter sp. XJ19-41]|uniref:Ig-like domain-containing protein n=1 Tax=Paucibacter sp. XJ19-41 TaxID=2927824 RepID=UPI00234906D9|nr:Ig-like domain-containing protein [Paucibacter sp. XJ19-41]MDC6168695.1 Ig-like domain-containing protein [Paucibacter sp. XJ19-41]
MAYDGMDRLRPLALICLSLTACGGGGGGDNTPPPSAEASADRYDLGWNASATTLRVLDNDKTSGGEAVLSIVDVPKNGMATVTAGTVSYTPKSGFYGEDSFSYAVAVGNSRATGQVTLNVTAALTLQGLVHDGPIANAKVSAQIGNQVFETTTDAQGRYSLPIQLRRPSDFVSLSAKGIGSQAHIELTSLIGEAAVLARAAQSASLSDTELPSLRINHLSSAIAGLIAQGREAAALPRSQTELQQASAALSQLELLNAAALVKLVVDHQVALPAGSKTTRELLSSATALSEFQRAQLRTNWTQFLQARDDTTGDPLLSRVPALGDSTAAQVFYLTHGVGGAITPDALRLALQPDGRAQSDWRGGAREASWKRETDALVLTFDTPQIEEVQAEAPMGSMERWTTTGLRIVDLGAGNGLFTPAGLRRVGESRNIDHPQLSRDLSEDLLMMRRYDAKALPGLGAGALEPGTRWIGPTAAGLAQGLRQDILHITGTSSARFERAGLELSWARGSDGALELSFPDGQLRHRYLRLGQGPHGEERWLLEEWLDGKFLRADELMALRAPATAPALPASLLGVWSSNLGAPYLEPARYHLRANGSGAVESGIPTPGQPEIPLDFGHTWRLLADGRFEMARGWGPLDQVCDPFAGSTDCRVFSRRFWTPVAVQGTTYFMLEQGPSSISNTRFVAMKWSALP